MIHATLRNLQDICRVHNLRSPEHRIFYRSVAVLNIHHIMLPVIVLEHNSISAAYNLFYDRRVSSEDSELF